MRNKIRFIIALFVLVTIEGCFANLAQAEEKAGPTMIITKTVSSVMKHFSKVASPPQTANKDAIAAEIDIRFPEFSSSAQPDAALTEINKAIQDRLLAILDDKTIVTVDQLSETFIKGYEQFMNDEPDNPGAWLLKFEANIRYADEDLLSIEIVDSLFTGGAHPTSNVIYLVFSLKTGKRLNLETLVADDKMGELTKLAEMQFRKVSKLKPKETYKQAGFQFEHDRFALNRNFLVSKAGLEFCFNQNEIGPYSMGITELVIPWTDLKTVVNTDGSAGRFLNQQH